MTSILKSSPVDVNDKPFGSKGQAGVQQNDAPGISPGYKPLLPDISFCRQSAKVRAGLGFTP